MYNQLAYLSPLPPLSWEMSCSAGVTVSLSSSSNLPSLSHSFPLRYSQMCLNHRDKLLLSGYFKK